MVLLPGCRAQVLDCLDLPAEYSSLLTTDDSETNLHAVRGEREGRWGASCCLVFPRMQGEPGDGHFQAMLHSGCPPVIPAPSAILATAVSACNCPRPGMPPAARCRCGW